VSVCPVVFFRPAHEWFLEAVWGFPTLADVCLSQLVNLQQACVAETRLAIGGQSI
jgi:hypothetical protein